MGSGNEAIRLRRLGFPLQVSMVVVWLLRGVFYAATEEQLFTTVSGVFGLIGFLFMIVAMERIYSLNIKPRQLITSDIFSFTRHPMYHGMYLVDIGTFMNGHLGEVFFWLSWLLFTGLIFAAGRLQEKETLARWGDEARAYYARTPRFIFEWLWWKRSVA